MPADNDEEELACMPYPNTCDECEDRGVLLVLENYLVPDRYREYNHETTDWEWKNLGWPKRCKPCNARAQGYKRAKQSIKRLEELRIMVLEAFEALGSGRGRYAAAGQNHPSERGFEDRWCYLKFVTLTWENKLTEQSEPDMKAARKWLRKKREKIIDKLDVVAGTDVLECVTTEKDGLYHHHVHSHGVWLMPYHDIQYVGEVMKKYVGRDQCRAIKPIQIENESGTFTMSAFAQARNYLMKYLTKEPGTRRGTWGFARKNLDAETFYGKVTAIHQKWSAKSDRNRIEV